MEQKQVKYWIEISEYDLEVAEAVFEKGYYLHCGFMCHQSVEKILKGLFVFKRQSIPPRTHNLDRIIKESGCEDRFPDDYFLFIDELTPLNIQARYPVYKEMLFKLIDKEKADTILEKTKALHKWLKQEMKLTENSDHSSTS